MLLFVHITKHFENFSLYPRWHSLKKSTYTNLNFQSTYKPNFPLSQFVETIWVAKKDELEVHRSHHAALFTELIFNYGDQFQVQGENTESFISKYNHHIISGLKTTPFQTTISGKYLNVGFMLKPHCYSLLIDRFASQDMRKLSDIIYEALVLPEIPQFKKLETVLIQFFKPLEVDSDLMQFENHISSESMRNGALRDFNNIASVTQKTFIQKFKQLYFLTPSEYIRLKQVNYATLLIQNHPKTSLTQIGLESGFYDQSHFIRVFKKHHGCTPKRFQKEQFPY